MREKIEKDARYQISGGDLKRRLRTRGIMAAGVSATATAVFMLSPAGYPVVEAAHRGYNQFLNQDDGSFAPPLATEKTHTPVASATPDATPSQSIAPTPSPTESPSPTQSKEPSASPSPSESSKTPEVEPNTVSNVVVIMLENMSNDAVSKMPYLQKVAEAYGQGTNYTALERPSLPNYVRIFTGSNQGISDDKSPTHNSFKGETIFGRAIKNGKTAAVYAEGMEHNCQQTDVYASDYEVHHNPWAYASDENELCRKYDVPMEAFAGALKDGTLPDISLVIPNNCNNGHDCPAHVPDDWLHETLDRIGKSDYWKEGHTLIVITSDEGSKADSDNKGLFVIVHPSLRRDTMNKELTTDSIGKLFAEVAGVEPLGAAKKAPSILDSFDLQTQ